MQEYYQSEFNSENTQHNKNNLQQHKLDYATLKYLTSNTIKTQTYKGNKVYIQTDQSFIKSINDICQRKKGMLSDIIFLKQNQLTEVQCQQIHSLSLLHREANIINQLSKYNQHHLNLNENLKVNYCTSGCDRFKGSLFSLMCNIQEINILGSSIIVYFMLLKKFIYTLLLFIFIFGIFSIIVNLLGVQNLNLKLQPCESSYCSFRDSISALNKLNYNEMMKIEGYLGLLGMIILIICMRWIKNVGTLRDKSIDKNLISSSDYALKINNLPYGQYNQSQLFEYLEKIGTKIQINQKVTSTFEQKHEISQNQNLAEKKSNKIQPNKQTTLDPLQFLQTKQKQPMNISDDIKSIQIIYNMKFSRQFITKLQLLCLQVNDMIKKEEKFYIIKNKEEYPKKKKELTQLYELFDDLRKKFLNDNRFRKILSTRTAIVQFYSEQSKNLLLKYYGKEKISIFKELKLRMIHKCFGSNSQLIFKGSIPSIIRAPEPSDILWENCQQKQSFTRIFIIYIATFFIILLSFGIILGIQYVQIHFLSTQFNSSNVQTILNIAISVALQIINKALWFSLFYLLDLEYNHTSTNKIISHMHKASFLMWINIILLPIFVEYVLSNTYFGGNGLSGIVFDYHVSALTISLLVKFIDPVNFILRTALCIKCIRNYLVRIHYKKTERGSQFPNKAMMNQIYALYQGPQFDIAESYVFIISNILHAFFFCSLQPFILILVSLQVFFFYWICKIRMLRICKIPSMTQFSIFQVSVYQLMLIPVFYGAGRLFHNYVYSQLDTSKEVQYIIGSISIFIGLVNYFNPSNIINKALLKLFDCLKCQQPATSKINSQSTISNEQIQHRIQDYYKNSNSLSLLGFQRYLVGEKHLGEIQHELKRFCGNCIPNKVPQLINDQFQVLGNLYDSTNNIQQRQFSKLANFV